MRRLALVPAAATLAGAAALAASPPPRGLTPNSLHVPGDTSLLGTLPSLLLVCIGVATLALVAASALRPGERSGERPGERTTEGDDR